MAVKLEKLHHVGIVMNEPERAAHFLKVFGLEEEYREYVPEYHAMCVFTRMAGTKLELIIPDGGVLRDYNGGKGGIHHIAFCVDDVEKARAEFESRGLGMLESKAVKGAGPIRVNFLRPRFGCGVLAEFVETTEE